MPTSTISVKLLSYANNDDCSFLETQLADLGFKFVTRHSIDEFQYVTNIEVGIIIIQIASLQNIKDKIIRFLQSTGKSKTLLLFNKDISINNDVTPLADEVISWPCNSNELDYRMQRLSRFLLDTRESSSTYYMGFNILGSSNIFTDTLKKAYKVSQCDAPALIEGETGTGKEVIARSIHYLSKREPKPFIAVNCGALP
ncbi:MAG: sigma 54-interacting transcriptional regulator, partial [Gammaproteobacteria bacterium]|nr:sigma 54-interacting transcriptional regulator [Gammaproteobacteria bacterium]